MKKFLILAVVSVMALGLFAGCSGDAEPQTFVGLSDEGRGYAEVELTMQGDEIVEVNIVEYTNMGEAKDYASYGNPDRFSGEELKEAHESLAEQIVETNSADVDAHTGATSTSNKVVQAVERALAKANDDVEGDYLDGTFFGRHEGERGYYIAHVTIENDAITAVNLEETQGVGSEAELKDEEYGYEDWLPAREEMQERFVNENSADVDAYTGATGSSEGWMEAVQDALNNAAVN
ncbi:FMN-binding protein [Proteinivorax hydrogeniformans]|uniref:FMN-binding protein n=1 Tax=Proteinivorax hydrogeniformans TaxID=1826727 RepID=A0AAU8HX55_9FIRM